MRRAIVIEKMGDCFKQYWLLPELDYPNNYDELTKMIKLLDTNQSIRVVRYFSKARITLLPWLFTENLYEDDGITPKTPELVFPFPIRNIRSEQDVADYNRWLQTYFKSHVLGMCKNSSFARNGWEGIDYKEIPVFNPVRVNITQYSLDRLYHCYNLGDDCDCYD